MTFGSSKNSICKTSIQGYRLRAYPNYRNANLQTINAPTTYSTWNVRTSRRECISLTKFVISWPKGKLVRRWPNSNISATCPYGSDTRQKPLHQQALITSNTGIQFRAECHPSSHGLFRHDDEFTPRPAAQNMNANNSHNLGLYIEHPNKMAPSIFVTDYGSIWD